jgi:hypothetical protein
MGGVTATVQSVRHRTNLKSLIANHESQIWEHGKIITNDRFFQLVNQRMQLIRRSVRRTAPNP